MKKLFFQLLALAPTLLFAQSDQPTAGELQKALNKLDVLGTALYIAAHPDDENTRLISYLANGELVRTAYLSMTRGGGGQNLIGTEKGELMSVVRTGELMAARRIDGGDQFFTRARDFGYSKNPEETLNIWNKDIVLSDMVWVIRYYRPDVLITRFNANSKRGHGHHTASAILAREAFEAAGDPARFPEHEMRPWQPFRLIYNTSTWRNPKLRELKASNDTMLVVDVGGFDPLLGASYPEIAARSRSQHKSQGFGSSARRGQLHEYFEPITDKKVPPTLFDGINISWKRAGAPPQVQVLTDELQSEFNPQAPEASVPKLLKLYSLMGLVKDPWWSMVKRKEIKELITGCLGLWIDAYAPAPQTTHGETIDITTEVVMRRPGNVVFDQIDVGVIDSSLGASLKLNQRLSVSIPYTIPRDLPLSRPYWTFNTLKGIYTYQDLHMRAHPDNVPILEVRVTLVVDKTPVELSVPVVYRTTDRVRGEVRQQLEVMPKVTAQFTESVYIHNIQTKINVELESHSNNVSGVLRLATPPGVTADPQEVRYEMASKGQHQTFEFTIQGKAQFQVDWDHLVETDRASITIALDSTIGQSVYRLDYEHIPARSVLSTAVATLVNTDVKVATERIGYIMGAGDEVPQGIEEMGVDVVQLTSENFDDHLDLSTIVMGVRAYNTEKWLLSKQGKLKSYVNDGGTLVLQYNTTRGLLSKDMGPYPFKLGRGRVTVEGADVTILQKKHKLFSYPNKISSDDFDNWVQERGLYFAEEWNEKYTPLLSMNDPGENALAGSLLVAHYGKGTFIYTGLSFFRQIPAGVPGAYRLLANVISYSNE